MSPELASTPGSPGEGTELHAAGVRGLRWTATVRPIVEVVLLAAMVLLARLISPAEFGRWAIAIIVGELAATTTVGLGTALTSHANASRSYQETAMALALLLSLGLAAATLLADQLIVLPIFGARTAELVRLTAVSAPLVAIGAVPGAMLQRRLDFGRLSILDLVGTVVRSGASIVLALAGLGAFALVWGGLTSLVVTTVLLCAWSRPPVPRIHRGPAGELLRYGLPASLAVVSWVGFRNCDYAIVGARLGPRAAGLYFRAYQLGVEYQKKISLVTSTIGFPLLARARSTEEMGALRTEMVRLLTLLLFPLLVVLAIVAPVLVPWLFGPRWAAAAVPTQILALGGASTLVIDCVGTALMAARRPTATLLFGWAHFAVYAGAVVAVSRLGLTAVAIAASVVHTGFLAVAYAVMLRGTAARPIRQLWHDVAPATTGCLLAGAVALPSSIGLRDLGLPAPIYSGAVSLIVACAYLIALHLCFPAPLRALVSVVGRVLPSSATRQLVRIRLRVHVRWTSVRAVSRAIAPW